MAAGGPLSAPAASRGTSRAASSRLSQPRLRVVPPPRGSCHLEAPGREVPGQLCPAEAAADPAVDCARGGRGAGALGPLSRGGCIMDHLWARLWPGVSSLCLLLAGAAWASPPRPLDPKFESKGKGGPVLDPCTRSWTAVLRPELPVWVLRAILGSEPPVLVLGAKLVSEPLRLGPGVACWGLRLQTGSGGGHKFPVLSFQGGWDMIYLNGARAVLGLGLDV